MSRSSPGLFLFWRGLTFEFQHLLRANAWFISRWPRYYSIQFVISLKVLSAGLSIELLYLIPPIPPPFSKMRLLLLCLELWTELFGFLIRSASLWPNHQCAGSHLCQVLMIRAFSTWKIYTILVTSIFPTRYSYRLACEPKNLGTCHEPADCLLHLITAGKSTVLGVVTTVRQSFFFKKKKVSW